MSEAKSQRFQSWKIRLWKLWYTVNIPIIVFLDSNAVLPAERQYSKVLLQGYIERFHDFLCKDPPKWLQFMTVVELGFQLPIALYCAYHLYNLRSGTNIKRTLERVDFWSKWYAFNVLFTTVFCIWYVWAFGYYPHLGPDHVMRFPDKLALTSVYVPYVIVPILFFV